MKEVTEEAAKNAEELMSAEEGVPAKQEPAEQAPESRSVRRKHYVLFAVAVVLILLAIGLSVGLTVGRKDDVNNSVSNPDDGPGTNTQDPDNNQNNNSTSPPPTPEPSAAPTREPTFSPNTTIPEEESSYNSMQGPFDVKIPLFGKSIIGGYASREELEESLSEVVKFVVNNAINRNLRVPGYENAALPMFVDDTLEAVDAPAPENGQSEGDFTAGVNDYETNTQEKGVDEGDRVKTDGFFVYAAYGDKLKVWNTTGELVTEVTMPAIDWGASNEFAQSPRDAIWWNPGPIVESLLLNSERLVVIVSGYGYSKQQQLDVQPPILYDYAATHVKLYDTSSLNTTGVLVEVASKDLNGYFREARSVGQNAHIITMTGINTYYPLIEPLERYQSRYRGLNDTDYEMAAAQLAEDKLIEPFVERLIDEISVDGVIPRLATISMWQTRASQGDDAPIFGNGVFTSLTQIHSFDVLGSPSELAVSVSGISMPSSWGYAYATEELLVIAGQGWDYIPELDANTQTTYLVGFKLQGDASEPASVGVLPGYLLNQFSLDYVKPYLRVATTIRNWWVRTTFVDEEGESSTVPQQVPATENQVVILEVPEIEGDEPSVMVEVGRIPDLGKENEVFTAVRFLDDTAFVVTFEQTDPFYVLDLANASDPRVLGELNITGFSRYLHPFTDDNSLVLAVGQEAKTDGTILGLQITLFDVTDPTQPTDLYRLVVEQDTEQWSSSAVEFDHKAFRLVSLIENEFAVLIIPVTIHSWGDQSGNFDGFFAFDVNVTSGISQRFNISHLDSPDFQSGCYYWAHLPERSMVFDGDVMTLKGHTVKSTVLGTGAPVWDLKVDVEKQEQCYYW